jgi:hypothetical protein
VYAPRAALSQCKRREVDGERLRKIAHCDAEKFLKISHAPITIIPRKILLENEIRKKAMLTDG